VNTRGLEALGESVVAVTIASTSGVSGSIEITIPPGSATSPSRSARLRNTLADQRLGFRSGAM